MKSVLTEVLSPLMHGDREYREREHEEDGDGVKLTDIRTLSEFSHCLWFHLAVFCFILTVVWHLVGKENKVVKYIFALYINVCVCIYSILCLYTCFMCWFYVQVILG